MSIPQLLHSMCADLPDADLNAIRKARGFSLEETASRTAFASFYITSIGLEKVMQTLSPEEAITLRLLNETGEVDTSFFERLYGANSHGTYTQRFKSTFDTVKKNLVRRGLVLMAEIKVRGESVQLERWRFALPLEFAPFIPDLPSVSSDQPGETSDRAIRRKLLQLIGGSPAIPNDTLHIHLQHGGIYLKDFPFALSSLQIWQSTAWRSALNTYRPNISASLDPTQAVLNLLSAETWLTAKAIEPALKIYCMGGPIPPTEKILQQGWELGLLTRLTINSVPHYRLALHQNPAGPNDPYPASLPWAITTAKSDSVKIDLRLIPLRDLEMLTTLAHIGLDNGALLAYPSLVKLGRALPEQRNSPLSRWLAENIPAFGKVLETVSRQWGKTILHEKLLFARVRDLSLRIQLERELKDKIVILNEHFIAFPLESRSSVEKVLKKTGFVIKTVKPSAT